MRLDGMSFSRSMGNEILFISSRFKNFCDVKEGKQEGKKASVYEVLNLAQYIYSVKVSCYYYY